MTTDIATAQARAAAQAVEEGYALACSLTALCTRCADLAWGTP